MYILRILDAIDKVTENVILDSSKEFKSVQDNIAVIAAPVSHLGFNGITLLTDIKPSQPLTPRSVSAIIFYPFENHSVIMRN